MKNHSYLLLILFLLPNTLLMAQIWPFIPFKHSPIQSTLDSSIVNSVFYCSVNGAYLSKNNWMDDTNSQLQIGSTIDYFYSKTSKKISQNITFKNNLSFVHIIDSIWDKNDDRFKFQYNRSYKGERRFETTWSILFQSQLLNDYTYNSIETNKKERWKGGFLNPSTIEIIYGFSKKLLTRSTLVVSLATIKLNVYPPYQEIYLTSKKNESLYSSSDFILLSSYGFYSQCQINEAFFNNKLLWVNDSRLFFNHFSKQGIQFELSNRITYKFLQFLQVSHQLNVLLNHDLSNKTQYKQEVLLGVFYQFKKKRST